MEKVLVLRRKKVSRFDSSGLSKQIFIKMLTSQNAGLNLHK